MKQIEPEGQTIEATTIVGSPEYGGEFQRLAGPPILYVLPGEVIASAGPPGLPLVVKPSTARVQPGCVHFGTCGGCHYQHANYTAQLGLKRQIFESLLADAGLVNLPQVRTHAGDPWGYRNRIRLRVEPAEDGYRVGYSRAGSNDFLPIHMCPIAAPLLWRAAQAVLAQVEDTDGRRWLAAAAEIELFCLPDESRLMLTLLLREASPARRQPGAFAGFCERLRGGLPELVGAGAELQPELNRRTRRAWAGAAWGVTGLAYPAAGETYWVPRGAFFQVNRLLVDRLVTLVCAGEAGGLAWDLYAGVGLFSKVLARGFERVIAVEGGEHAASSLQAASRGSKGVPGLTALQMATLDFLRGRVLERERPELVVLDPPRAGLGVEGAALLTRVAASRVVYVSCDPVTLARDLAVLTREVYQVAALDLVDLFPQTYHVEAVVHLERR